MGLPRASKGVNARLSAGSTEARIAHRRREMRRSRPLRATLLGIPRQSMTRAGGRVHGGYTGRAMRPEGVSDGAASTPGREPGAAGADLLTVVYEQLRALARSKLRSERR